ncbi:hypothetical protein F66182_6363 [Fusarium sp. NRRL 66182]|nr:hypothetical protein F66182_6363 [Fusarium sp. NRRL 66182]
MVYQWEPHRDVCYQLYINERRSLEDIMVHMKNVYQFTPSKRAFQVQFSRWRFPSKQRLAHKDDLLVKRIHELWQKNIPQREMLRVLNDEDGFDINSRELMRVRSRNRWLLRVRDGDRARSGDADHDIETGENDSWPAEDGNKTTFLPDQERGVSVTDASEPKSRKISKRQSRRNRQNIGKTESIVRFPSEMTLNDSKDVLGLDANTYPETRECFARICQEEFIVKKTLAGPERWDYIKRRLITERPNLQEVLWLSKENLEKKQLALDIICTDVTKRLRNQGTHMTLVDAKNELGLNPEESHEVRAALHEVLSDASFTCKTDGTPEKWEELKRRWIEKSAHLKNITFVGDDEQSRRKAKAVEVVARDVIKRKRDEKRIKDKGVEADKQKGPVQHSIQNDELQRDTRDLQNEQQQQQQQQQGHRHHTRTPSTLTSEREASRPRHPSEPIEMHESELGTGMDDTAFEPIHGDPANSQMAFTPTRQPVPQNRPTRMQPQVSNLSNSQGGLPQPHRMLGSSPTDGMPINAQYESSSMYMANDTQSNFMQQQYVPHQFPVGTPNTMFQAVPTVSTAFAVFLRLHPSSTYITNTSLWISTMESQSVQELRQVAVAKFPGALCVRIEGILKDAKGTELPLQIQGDDELGAYFAHMQGGSPTFAVQLV